jgi:hypothetical protein
VSAAENEYPRNHHLGFWLKGKSCVVMVWQKEDNSNKIHYHRVGVPCYLFLLPTEVRMAIADYAMIATNGEVHISEARGQMTGGKVRITSGEQMPPVRKEDAFFGDIHQLKTSFNGLKHVHPEFASYRGKELLYNTLACNGYSFVSFIKYAPKEDIWKHVRKVRLCGNFGLGLHPDENLLHPIIKFAQQHADASINIELWDMELKSSRDLSKFMRFVYCIRAAMLALPRPNWLEINKKDELKSWLRAKQPGELGAKNVHFFPKDHHTWDDDKDFDRLRKMMRGEAKNALKRNLILEYGDRQMFVSYIRCWFMSGICSDLSSDEHT